MGLPLLSGLIGGNISRCCGGGTPLGWLAHVRGESKVARALRSASAWEIPFGLDQFIFALPFLLIFWGSWILALVSYAVAVLGKRTGHGQYLSFGHFGQQAPKYWERLDFIVRFFMGVDVAEGVKPSYWRCAVGMVVTGLAVTLVPGVLYALAVDPVIGLALALSGATKPLGYMLGWELWRTFSGQKEYDGKTTSVHPNVYGEFFAGFVPWMVLAWAL